MLKLPIHLTLNYLGFNKKDKNISFMIKVCFAGIFIGTLALMLTLIVTNGFEKTIHEKIQGINSQVIINMHGNKLDLKSLSQSVSKLDDVLAVSGSTSKQIILNIDGEHNPIIIKGLSPNEENVTNLNSKIIHPKQNLNSLLCDNNIIIGHKLAKEFHLKVGETVKILIPDGGSKSKIYLTKHKVKIAGIFNVGLDEYDSGFVFTSINFLNDIFDEVGVEEISIKLKENKSYFKNIFYNYEQAFIDKLKNTYPALTIQSWKDLYPALVSSLKLEKYVMFLIIALITMVATLNMVSLLFIYIQQKRKDIAILKTLGMRSRDIELIFILMGLTITFFASTLGLVCAGVIGFILERYPLITLPDIYYVTHLPARMEIELFITVFIVTMLLGLLATWIPARRTREINISEVLRME